MSWLVLDLGAGIGALSVQLWYFAIFTLTNMIKLLNVNKHYQIDHTVSQVLSDINLEIKDKEFIGILGASGSGKSTLMHILGLLDVPSSGEVYYDDHRVSELSDRQLSHLRNQYVGFVFQQFNLIDKLSVLDNVLLPAQYAKKRLPFNPRTHAEELLQRFGIYDRKDYYPNRISGGQQQRVAIARALVMNPKLILADEPTGNLDSKTGEEILSLIENLNHEFGVTVVMVTHDPKIAARTKRQIYIKDGRIEKRLKKN